ncbi:MAG: YbaK/EbsC family protein [Actinomycetota bacterium]|nr:YbaK/EbsC family protein [Actinomycetota bacterium]
MAVNQKLSGYLDSTDKQWELLSHSESLSSVDEARALGIDPDEVAKSLVLKGREGYALAVIPGGHRLDMHKVRDATDDKTIRLASEDDLERDFPDYELGAAPPAPDLLNVHGFVDPTIRSREWIVFAAGTHTDSVRMKTADLIGLSDFTEADLVETGEE